MKYPEHEKLKARESEARLLSGFIDFISEQGWYLAEYEGDSERCWPTKLRAQLQRRSRRSLHTRSQGHYSPRSGGQVSVVPLETVVIIGAERWVVKAVTSAGLNERYYFLTRGENEVTFFPAFMLEDEPSFEMIGPCLDPQRASAVKARQQRDVNRRGL